MERLTNVEEDVVIQLRMKSFLVTTEVALDNWIHLNSFSVIHVSKPFIFLIKYKRNSFRLV